MLSRKCSRDEPNHNIGAFFNTIDPERTSEDAAILKSSARSQKFHGNFCLVPDRQLLLADYNFLLMIV
jgi:hypothetical protein